MVWRLSDLVCLCFRTGHSLPSRLSRSIRIEKPAMIRPGRAINLARLLLLSVDEKGLTSSTCNVSLHVL
jgi:hypothetical protein